MKRVARAVKRGSERWHVAGHQYWSAPILEGGSIVSGAREVVQTLATLDARAHFRCHSRSRQAMWARLATAESEEMGVQPWLQFWGKANSDAESGVAWHPVAYHLLDVAATAEAILAARPIARVRAGSLLHLAPDDASRLLVALIALHDVGKFAPAFQVKAPEHWPIALGACIPDLVRPGRHTEDGYTLWRGTLATAARDRLWPTGRAALDALAPAIFGHHGRPVGCLYGQSERQAIGTGLGSALTCADAALALLMPVPIEAPDLSVERARLASWWVAGLTSVADWVGSNERWFPYTAPLEGDASLGIYWDRARGAAYRAVREAGLAAPTTSPRRSFGELTRQESPTPAQRWADETELPAGPLLVIVEDVTGAGKTEAAQMLVHRLMTEGRAAGAYWAMPTQATANAMYDRQARAFDALFARDSESRPSLVLAHGQQKLHTQFRATVLADMAGSAKASGVNGARDSEAPSSVACAAFLADDRRAGLLADVGAGTIDQAILGVLPSKFNAIRLFGLADKVLVVDEAHAYDPYMGVEVQELLRFHAALGGCAIVLSATLSTKQREAMATAWIEGLAGGRRRGGLFHTPAALTGSTSYPLATLVSGDVGPVREDALEAADWSHRRVAVRLIAEPDGAIEHVLRAAELGGSVAWVRNTVNDCLVAAALLRERGLEDVLVFHARFAQGDRQQREQEVLALFGPNASNDDRRGRVLVATQVIEQSLDLDFDAMVSDVAPIDFLVQRAGRLQRHRARDAERPAGLVCELVVLAPKFAEEPAADWLSGVFKPTSYVYGDVGVLWRTVRALVGAGSIDTPDGLRDLIAQVYDSDFVPQSLLPVAQRAEGQQHGQAATANFATLKVSDGYDASAQAWVSELRAPTRLGDQQTTVRLARVVADGTLAPWVEAPDRVAWKSWALSEVRLSAWKVPLGSTAEARYDAAVARARADWGKWEQEIPVVPLVEAAPGEYRATLTRPDGAVRDLGYDSDRGVTYHAE